jgi:hypothetical protein
MTGSPCLLINKSEGVVILSAEGAKDLLNVRPVTQPLVSPVAERRWKLALTAGLALYGMYLLAHVGEYGFMDSVDLPIHETGHLVFNPFGEFIQFLGGTLFQLIVPSVFVIYFWRRKDRYAASVVLWWVAQNFWNIAVYVQDARAEELPLVGGGEHDWAYLLGRLGWLRHDIAIGRGVRLVGICIFVYSVVLGFTNAGKRAEAPPLQ